MSRAPLLKLSFLLLIFSVASSLRADAISISGIVKDSAGKPLAGVDVSVAAAPTVKAATGIDGSFHLAGSYTPAKIDPTVSPVFAKMQAGKASIIASKDGLMSTRVLVKDNAGAIELTLYPALTGNVTLTGNLLGSAHVLGMTAAANKEKSVFILAFDGDPGIKAEFNQIIKDYWPEDGSLDGDSARELETQFMERLKYNLDGPEYEAMWKEVAQHPYVNACLLTGDVHPAPQGKTGNWISATAYGKTKFNYPPQIVAQYKPLTMPSKPPLEIKLSDTVSIKLIYIAPGKFYMGGPLYQIPHWEEAPQHMVTLSKGYYMAETPITYEQYVAITGDNAAQTVKDYKSGKTTLMPPDSAVSISEAMLLNFCNLLEKKIAKTVRPPTAAEWEYAARCGVSNPSCSPTGGDRIFPSDPVVEKDTLGPVKHTQPNGWGFYEMKVVKSSERTSDEEVHSANEHADVTDPSYPVKQDFMNPIEDDEKTQRIHCCKGADEYPITEMLRSGMGRGWPAADEWNRFAKRARIVIPAD